MVPLVVADYPKQFRSNPEFTPIREPSAPEANEGANIGWNIKPVRDITLFFVNQFIFQSAPSAPRDFENL